MAWCRISAASPGTASCRGCKTSQAKGRVERMNGTLQDRLVKELRLRGISSMADANAYAPAFIADFNARFAKGSTQRFQRAPADTQP